MPQVVKKEQNRKTRAIFNALKRAFPELPDEPEEVVYQYNPIAIRVRVVSPKFRGKSAAEREEMINGAIRSVSPKVTEDISMLFMLTPEEANHPTLLHREFDDPTDSYL
jgi:stress-induced morphogen